MSGITPRCIFCQVESESFCDRCQCDGAKEDRVAHAKYQAIMLEQSREREADRKAAQELQSAKDRESGQAVMAKLRREFAADQSNAALDTDLESRERAVKSRELTQREHRQDRAEPEPFVDDTPTPQTFADFGQEITLLGAERLPAAFERSDGATLLYEGVANTIYGEPSTGKSWIALMASIQRLHAGRRVIWWDAEDPATTLARRLQLLRATDLIGCPELAWRTGDMHLSETAMAGALEFLSGGNGPGLVVIDSATSFGCPKDGADVQPWLKAYIKPWLNAGHTTIQIDHVPKQRKDRPAGAVGSYEKLSDIRGAALYAHGTAWDGQNSGAIHLTIHKDAAGQLPAPKFSVATTVTAAWDGLTLDWKVGLPNAKDEGEDVQDELLTALDQAGPEGVRGSRAIRDLMAGKRGKDVDLACEELTRAGMIEKVQDGRAFIYTVAK